MLDPQIRELERKADYSMRKAGLSPMADNLTVVLFAMYFFTGSVEKMEKFILDLSNGQIFLMDDQVFRLENIATNLPKTELIKSLLLYHPAYHPDGVDLKGLEVISIRDFMGPVPAEKPWIYEWHSEVQELRRQAAAELGAEQAAEPLAAYW